LVISTSSWAIASIVIEDLMIESMSIESVVKVNKLEEVAQGRKCAFADMVSISCE
jgi:hypothetical protein